MLTDIENVVFAGRNQAHSVTKLHYDEQYSTLRIVVTPEGEFENVLRSYVFKGVKNFEYQLDAAEDLENWPRSIIGMDFYPGRTREKWNTVINCGDVEFTFFSPELPVLDGPENS